MCFVCVASVYSDTLSVAAISTISMELPVDTEEKLLEALEHTKDDLKLTNDEEKRLTKAFKERKLHIAPAFHLFSNIIQVMLIVNVMKNSSSIFIDSPQHTMIKIKCTVFSYQA